jgi:putative selenate reductase
VSAAKLRRLAAAAAVEPRCRKDWRGDDPVRVDGPLPLFDCFVAPCVAACPIGQDVPGYLRLAGLGRLSEAFALVHEANPLPFITAHLCDHQCMSACTRRDWEGPVLIRDVKRVVAEGGCAAFRAAGWAGRRRAPSRGVKAAVIGAGPAGLAAAAFLAREGFAVEVHEHERAPGGVVRHAVPGFRIPDEAIRRDIELLGDLGVSFRFGSSPTVAELRSAGARHVLAAVGSPLDAPAGVEGARGALEFLREYRADPRRPAPGRSVAVIGAGDTAMDAARAARRCRGVREVTVVYRRTAREMPASREEYDAARAEGVVFRFLASPERRAGRTLTCREMTLGDPGPDGRRRPVATDRTFDLEADTVIAAVGSGVDPAAIAALQAEGAVVVGDAATGPATIVKAIASARDAVREIVDREGGPRWEALRPGFGAADDPLELRAARDRTIAPADASRKSPAADANLRAVEATRCLGCEALCLKCVEVCPNRANTYVAAADGLRDAVQVIHLDALCNECGNCATFCPWDGKPYTDKLTVYVTEEDFRAAASPGFLVDGGRLLVRLGGTVREAAIGADGRLPADALPPGPDAGPARAVIEAVLRDHRHLLGGPA